MKLFLSSRFLHLNVLNLREPNSAIHWQDRFRFTDEFEMRCSGQVLDCGTHQQQNTFRFSRLLTVLTKSRIMCFGASTKERAGSLAIVGKPWGKFGSSILKKRRQPPRLVIGFHPSNTKACSTSSWVKSSRIARKFRMQRCVSTSSLHRCSEPQSTLNQNRIFYGAPHPPETLKTIASSSLRVIQGTGHDPFYSITCNQVERRSSTQKLNRNLHLRKSPTLCITLNVEGRFCL